MQIGAHVSTAGGLARAVERGVELGCESIQIFHQNPRMWRPTAYGEDDFAAFRAGFEASKLSSVVIHAVYLVNCASRERPVRTKSLVSLKHALQVGDAIGSARVRPDSSVAKPRCMMNTRPAQSIIQTLLAVNWPTVTPSSASARLGRASTPAKASIG